MIEFSYRRENLPGLLGWEHRRDCSLATRGDLLWYFFPVDILIRSDGREIETRHAGIPLLHFTLAVIGIAGELSSSDSGVAHYVFTESEEELSFTRRADIAEIRSSFDATILEFPAAELGGAVKDFSSQVIDDLVSGCPSLSASPVVAEVAAGLEGIQ